MNSARASQRKPARKLPAWERFSPEIGRTKSTEE
jgi:hypothetical protein